MPALLLLQQEGQVYNTVILNSNQSEAPILGLYAVYSADQNLMFPGEIWPWVKTMVPKCEHQNRWDLWM